MKEEEGEKEEEALNKQGLSWNRWSGLKFSLLQGLLSLVLV